MSKQGGRRRQPGPHAARPKLGVAVARTVASIEAAADILATVDSRALCLEAVSGAYQQASTPERIDDTTYRSVVTGALIGLLARNRHSADRRAVIDAWEHPETVLVELGTNLSDLSSVIETLRWRGIDAERVAWDIIGYESMRHYPLVLREANRMAANWADRSPEELVGYGWNGLRLALRAYNPEKYMFSTYACPKIRGTIRDGLRSESHLPKRLTTLVSNVENGRDELTLRLGRHPTLVELAEHLDMEIEQLSPIGRYATPASLDETYQDESDSRQIADPQDVEDETMQHVVAEAVRHAIGDLPDGEADVVRLLYLDELSTSQVAAALHITTRQVRSRRDRAFERLSAQLSSWYQHV
jgi:RNA polymerase sigma factor (sigma-70 family)